MSDNKDTDIPQPLSLKRRMLNSGMWSLLSYAFNILVRFGTNLFMTRMLVPEFFGILAIAMTVMVGLGLVSDFGLKVNVVQSKRGNDPLFLNTVWVTQILRGMVLWSLALFISLILYLASSNGLLTPGNVYSDPNLPLIIAILSTIMVIHGFQSTRTMEASRNLALGPLTAIDIFAQAVGLICMIAWVIVDRSIWALVAGPIAAALTLSTLSHLCLKGTPNRWRWDRSAFQELVNFGKWIFLSSILGFLVISADRFLLGGLVSPTTLGVYVIAFLIFNAIEQILARLISDLTLSAFSEIVRERPTELKATYYRIHKIIAAFAYSSAGILMTSGETLIWLLYDNRYHDAGWMLQILAAALLMVPFRLATQYFFALGMPKLHSYLLALQIIAFFVSIPLGFHLFGLKGAVWGIVIAHYSTLPLTILLLVRFSVFDLKKEAMLLPLVFGGAAIGVMLSFLARLAA
jgi:O-antigen/teichoic acid export membrane protein